MNPIKIMFFDIDGTLLEMGARQPSPKTLEALKGLKDNGIKICIATGRSPICVPTFEGVEFDAFLTFNGSYCYDAQGPIYENPIAPEAVARIVQNASSIGRPVAAATKDRIGTNGLDKDLADYAAIGNLTLPVAPDFELLCQENIYQLMLGLREPEYPAILEGVTGAKIAAWWDRAVDVIPASGGKGAGVRAVLRHFQLSPENAMAFGDGNNDIEMLEAVGTGVAMGNASEQLQSIADATCGTVAQDGIYAFCMEQGLISIERYPAGQRV